MNRRDFLQRLEAAAAAALCGGAALPLTGCIGFHYVNATVRGNTVAIARREFESTKFALVDVPGLPLPLYVYQATTRTASRRSPRAACIAAARSSRSDGHLVCPCHGSEYTNQGEVMKGPTLLPLERYVVMADDEAVIITLSERAS